MTEHEAPSSSPKPARPPFRDPKPTAERIFQLAERVRVGDILLPKFQRGFVWTRKKVINLLDSVGRNYPIGSMLLWQSNESLANVRSIADLSIAETRPGYPVNYLLDGQQRLSTICGALYWSPGPASSMWNLAYDLKTQKFMHLDSLDEPPLHIVPLRHMSNPASYFGRLVGLQEQPELYARAQALFNRFTDYQVAIVTLGDMSLKDVAPVFERINSTGTPLTIVDLMRAATWSPTFDLVDAIDDILKALEPKKFSTVDRKTLLRTVAAAAGQGFSSGAIEDLRKRTETTLKADVAQATEAAKRAADFLSTQIGAPGVEALPYGNQFAVLTEVFRQLPHPTQTQLEAISRWFWRTSLSGYFSGWNTGQMAADYAAVGRFAGGQDSDIANSSVLPQSSIWTVRQFRSNVAASKMLGLMLAYSRPVDLLTGQALDLGRSLSWSNDREFHHFFPKGYLVASGKAAKSNVVANIILLSSHSNVIINDKAPSVYLNSIIQADGKAELLRQAQTNLISEEAVEAALTDDFEAFLKIRASTLQQRALELVGRAQETVPPIEEAPGVPDEDDDTDEDVPE